MSARKLRSNRKTTQPPSRIPLSPELIYSGDKEAALASGVSPATIFRARDCGSLKFYRRGARILISGAFLLDWLKQGEEGGRDVKEGGQDVVA